MPASQRTTVRVSLSVAKKWAKSSRPGPSLANSWYLSLLGTHPDHRGHGFGMRLLAENLKVVDTERTPAFLESTNPINHDHGAIAAVRVEA